MNLDALLAVLAPPAAGEEVPTDDDWAAIESENGILPNDYKVFLKRFGTGCIDNFLWILNPISANRYLNLFKEQAAILSSLRELKKSGEPCPYSLFPEPTGLLPFGKTDNGDALFWLRQGDIDTWPVVVNAARDSNYEEFSCDAMDFLTGILTRQIRCSVFPEAFPSNHIEFKPLST